MTRDAPRRRKLRRAKALHPRVKALHPRMTSLKPGFRRKNLEDNLRKLQAVPGNTESTHLHCLQEELNSSAWLPNRIGCFIQNPVDMDSDSEVPVHVDEEIGDANAAAENEGVPSEQDANGGLQLLVTGGNRHGTQSAPRSTVHENNRVSLGSMLLIWRCWCGIIRIAWYMEDLARPAGAYVTESCEACEQGVNSTTSF